MSKIMCSLPLFSYYLEQLQNRITQVVAGIDRQMLRHGWQEMEQNFRITNGGYMEQL